ncbi:MAG TPA: hypothetical protein P5136_00235 [Methanofastidiosum sp.]|nr:hypothetical protein [Methanofastidiosum sp.]
MNLQNLKQDSYPFLTKTLSKLDELSKDKPDLEVKRINALKNLHLVGKKSAWLAGELLVQQDKILKERYESWKKANPLENNYNQPKSVYQWVEIHTTELGFGVKTTQRYIRLREETDQDIGDRLGIKKADIIRKAPKELREKIRTQAVEEKWTAAKVEKVVTKIQEKEVKVKTFQEVIKPKLPKINVLLDPKNKSRIILEMNEKYRDTFNEIFQEKFLLKIREELYRILCN